MKNLYLLFLLLSFQIPQAQVIDSEITKSQQELFDYYNIKQKNQKKTAWILLGSGVVMGIVGIAILENNSEEIITDIYSGKGSSSGNGSTFLIITGGASTLASIPFFISAGNNKRKATISLKGEQNSVGIRTLYKSNYLGVALTLDF